MRWIHLCGAACIASLLPSGASAVVIFDQSIDPFWALGSEGFPLLADDFTLQAGASTITDIHWWGVYASGNTPTEPDNFTVLIFEDINGPPANSLVFVSFVGDVGRVDTGIDLIVSLQDVYAYSVDISPLSLAANTTYWLSISNPTPTDTDDNWYWMSVLGGNAKYFAGDSWPEQPPGWSLGFQLTNGALAVPEPATWALFAAGLAGLGMMNRRKAG